MKTAAQIRQQFLDFFREKQHTLVPSSSLMPDSPNLLFTNAGMNQFVPIFLGEKKADVSKWGGAIPASDTRAADTQKCIRAGGKHNDLDDVGLDTYHHTFFEMLGNWSFGDYFKKEAIDWAWELIVERWGFPADRVYATIYNPDRSLGDPADRDEEAWSYWAEKFRAVGLNPSVHIVNGNKKDNFWMMGETGPCGPCSELHIDLTPLGDTRGALVNKGVPECIEIWNLVFIQFNARITKYKQVPTADGQGFYEVPIEWAFDPLPAQHVDTGMGFERVASIIQGTRNFTDFPNAKISNYETDIFRPIFDELEKMSGKTYRSTLPTAGNASAPEPPGSAPVPGVGEGVPPSRTSADAPHIASTSSASDLSESSSRRDAGTNARDERAPRNSDATQIQIDVAFRVIADHIRTLSFAIADGIQPGNTDRNYVLRRILRRAVSYGRTLGFREPFFYKLVAVLARTMGDVFPEIRTRQKHVEEVIRREEEAFNKTLDKGNALLEDEVFYKTQVWKMMDEVSGDLENLLEGKIGEITLRGKMLWPAVLAMSEERIKRLGTPEELEFYDNAKEVSQAFYIRLVEQQIWQEAAPHLQMLPDLLAKLTKKKAVVSGKAAFLLYDTYGFPLDLTELKARERGLTVDTAGFEVEMEKQRTRARAAQKKTVIELSEIETKTPTHFVGYDLLSTPAKVLEVVALKDKTAVILDTTTAYAEMGGQVGDSGELSRGADSWRIANTQKSGATWLHFVDGVDAPEVGTEVTFGVEVLRRRAIERHHSVTHLLHWALHEVVSHEATQKGSFVGPDKLTFDFNSAALSPAQVRDIERLVNEKIVENAAIAWTEVPYAEVRGRADIMQFFGDKYGETVRVVDIGGYSKELCAGTHTRATGEIGLFRIASEAAIAAGVRRIEAVAGFNAYDLATSDTHRLHTLATKLGTPLPELEKRIDAMLTQQKDLERALKAAHQREAAGRAKDLLAHADTVAGMHAIIAKIEGADGDTLQAIADALKAHGFPGVVILGGNAGGAVALVATVPPALTAKVQAGKIIGAIAPLVGGKGGGKPEAARGGGKDPTQLDAALAKARELLG